ncbi:MAG: magnesium transporter [Tissierella sp.]|uniref:magnesium transporter n=1 Tax=Tissierella sp. TaxID=41274 RepID=UPI003F995ABC
MNEIDILQLIEQKKYVELKKELVDMNPIDIAEVMDEIDPYTTLLVFRMLPKDIAVEVFSKFTNSQQREIVSSVTDKELNHILDELFFDDMIDIIEEMPANVVNKILQNSTVDERKLINEFLKYPEDSSGTIMTIEYVDLNQNMTVKEALEHIKEVGLNKETVYTCYVVDENRILEGIVSLRVLVTSEEDQIVRDLMVDVEDVVFANTHDDQEIVADLFLKYGYLAIPVVDKERRLTGIITVDDIMDVMEQEATEDFQKMAAMAPTEDAYLGTSIFTLARHRITWLLILMVGATLTAGIINRYENILSSMVVLMAFVPMLMDTGGNSGNQSSTLIIRGMATGDVTLKDKWKVLWKEFRVSILVGISLGIVNFFKNIFLDGVGKDVAITVSITLFATVVMAKMAGSMLPLIAKKLNLDPAIMAGPLITTLVDSLALIVYFSIASMMLGL